MDLVALYCPLGGVILNSYVITCSNTIVPLKCGGRVIFIEGNPDSFQLVAERLYDVARIILEHGKITQRSGTVHTICGKRVSLSAS